MFPVSLGLWHFDLLSGVKIAHPRGGRGAGGGGGKQSIFKDEVRAGHPRAQDPLVRLL